MTANISGSTSTNTVAASTLPGARSLTAALGITGMTLDELHELQTECVAERDMATASLRAISDHLKSVYGDNIRRAYERAGKEHGTVWVDAGGGMLLEVETDRATVCDTAALGALLLAHPQLLSHVRIEVRLSDLAHIPQPLRGLVEAAMTTAVKPARVRLYDTND